MKCDKYTTEYIRDRIHHIIDRMDNKSALYNVWVALENARIKELKEKAV